MLAAEDRRAFSSQAIGWALFFGVLLGVPTDVIETPLFSRMTPTAWWDYGLWGVTAILGGLVLAAHRLPGAAACSVTKPTVGGGALGFLAVGCPLCNRLVVAALGSSGALTYFAPVQPIIGLLGIMSLALVLRRALALATRGNSRLVPSTEARHGH